MAILGILFLFFFLKKTICCSSLMALHTYTIIKLGASLEKKQKTGKKQKTLSISE